MRPLPNPIHGSTVRLEVRRAEFLAVFVDRDKLILIRTMGSSSIKYPMTRLEAISLYRPLYVSLRRVIPVTVEGAVTLPHILSLHFDDFSRDNVRPSDRALSSGLHGRNGAREEIRTLTEQFLGSLSLLIG